MKKISKKYQNYINNKYNTEEKKTDSKEGNNIYIYDNQIKNYNQKNNRINRSEIKKKILISIIITLVILFATSLLIYFKVIKPNNNNEIKPDKSPSPPIPNTKGNDIIFGDPYKVPSKTPLKNIISNWPYEEIESKICSQIIFQNHILLNETINNISDYLINESDLKIIVNISKISYSPPDYLINPTTNTLKILKSDIELYKNIYQRLSIDIYNFTLKKYETLNNIYSSLNDIKEDFIYLLYQFKENVKNISIPFILEREGLLNKTELNKNISLFDEIEKYKNEINNLNDLYNIFFKYINNEIQIIVDEINIIKNYTLDLQRTIEEQKEIFIKKLEEFNIARDNLEYHEILIQIKNTIISIREEINKKKKN
jgi:hypothetical protein